MSFPLHFILQRCRTHSDSGRVEVMTFVSISVEMIKFVSSDVRRVSLLLTEDEEAEPVMLGIAIDDPEQVASLFESF